MKDLCECLAASPDSPLERLEQTVRTIGRYTSMCHEPCFLLGDNMLYRLVKDGRVADVITSGHTSIHPFGCDIGLDYFR